MLFQFYVVCDTGVNSFYSWWVLHVKHDHCVPDDAATVSSKEEWFAGLGVHRLMLNFWVSGDAWPK